MPISDNYNADYSDFGAVTGDCCCLVCPVGTVALTDANGKQIGCVTPADAVQYQVDSLIPTAGSGKYFDPTSGQLIGIFTPDELTAWKAANA